MGAMGTGLVWVMTFWVVHLIVASIPDDGEDVQVLDDLQQPALPRMPALPTLNEAPLAAPAGSEQRKLGETQRAAKIYDTPEEELEALAKEDHTANMKAMEEAEHLKATERAKTKGVTVPEEVTCYHDLARRAKTQNALAERLEEEANQAAERLKQADYLKEQAAAAAEKLKRRMDRDHKMKSDAEGQYRKEHSVALNAFEAAKGNLDNYNNDRKKVDLDSNRAKQVLQKYLEYKKKFIQASANADDPTQSKEVIEYRRLAEQYLKQYHGLQQKMQESYTSAQHESEQYTTLSQRYQKIAGDANDIAAEVSQTSSELIKSRKMHQVKHKEFVKQKEEAERFQGVLTQKKEGAKAASTKFKELEEHAEKSKVNYFKLTALSEKYSRMGKGAERKVELNRVRLFNFEQESNSVTQEIDASIKSVTLLKRKYETADATGMVYTKAWRAGGCQTAADKKEGAPATPAAWQSAARQLLQEEPILPSMKITPEECEVDKSIATKNLEGAAQAKAAHQHELVHFTSLKSDHEAAVSGAKIAKAIMTHSKVKARRFLEVAEHATTSSADPCQI